MKKYVLILFVFAVFVNNSSAQWVRVEGIPQTNIPSIFIEGNTLYAGADSVIYISKDAGKSWSRSSVIHPSADFISSVVKYGNSIYAGTYNYGIFRSDDEGQSWQVINDGLPTFDSRTISDFVIENDHLYAGTIGGGVFSLDLKNPSAWIHKSDGLYYNTSYNVESLIKYNGRLYAGAGANGYFFEKETGSDTWKEVKFDIVGDMPLSFHDMIQLGNNIFISTSNGIYKSTDGGSNFSKVDILIGYVDNSNFAQYGNKVYVHFSKGLGMTYWFVSTDNGETWKLDQSQYGIEILNLYVYGTKLYAARWDGLWYLPLETTGVEDEKVPNDFVLNQNYPNPFNPVTKICFSVPEAGNVRLTVFDLLGREITTLANGFILPGNHVVDFNASNLTSGVYIYKLQSDKYSIAKKLTLIK